jgi:hypothetical protein
MRRLDFASTFLIYADFVTLRVAFQANESHDFSDKVACEGEKEKP